MLFLSVYYANRRGQYIESQTIFKIYIFVVIFKLITREKFKHDNGTYKWFS